MAGKRTLHEDRLVSLGEDDRYRLIRLVAQDGLGEIWQAEDTSLRAPITIRIVAAGLTEDRARVESFRRRVGTLHEGLDHPNVVWVFSYSEGDGPPEFVVMEELRGQTLAHRLRHGPALKAREGFGIAGGIAEGLHAAHDRGFSHGVLSADSVMLNDDGSVKILDFGLVELVPDAADGGGPAGDVLALGKLLREMSGARSTASPSDLRPGPAVGVDVVRLWQASLDPDPASRPTAQALAEALKAAELAVPESAEVPEESVVEVTEPSPESAEVPEESVVDVTEPSPESAEEPDAPIVEVREPSPKRSVEVAPSEPDRPEPPPTTAEGLETDILAEDERLRAEDERRRAEDERLRAEEESRRAEEDRALRLAIREAKKRVKVAHGAARAAEREAARGTQRLEQAEDALRHLKGEARDAGKRAKNATARLQRSQKAQAQAEAERAERATALSAAEELAAADDRRRQEAVKRAEETARLAEAAQAEAAAANRRKEDADEGVRAATESVRTEEVRKQEAGQSLAAAVRERDEAKEAAQIANEQHAALAKAASEAEELANQREAEAAARRPPTSRRRSAGRLPFQRKNMLGLVALMIGAALVGFLLSSSDAEPANGRGPGMAPEDISEPTTSVMPDLRGLPYGEALLRLEDSDLELGRRVKVQGQAGVVQATQPGLGQPVGSGTEVTLYVGEGLPEEAALVSF